MIWPVLNSSLNKLLKLQSKPSILFVPFSDREDNCNLRLAALNWIKIRKETGKSVPQLIAYNEGDLSKIPNEANIYILAHGMHNTTDVANTDYVNPDASAIFSTLSIEEIAHRIKASLNPAFQGTIKLYFCEGTQGTAKDRAKIFNLSLDGNYSKVRIDYYSGSLTPPVKYNETSHKKAFQVTWSQVDGSATCTEIGRASEVRATLDRELIPFVPSLLFSPISHKAYDKSKVDIGRVNASKQGNKVNKKNNSNYTKSRVLKKHKRRTALEPYSNRNVVKASKNYRFLSN